MTPHFSDDHLTVYCGDARDVLPALPAESVNCVVTSPPYWGLRDYGTATWEGGREDCDHAPSIPPRSSRPSNGLTGGKDTVDAGTVRRGDCHCGARRIDSQLGLEPTPEEYVANLVAVFREVRRVLTKDGTVWLNLGDSYASDMKGSGGVGSAKIATKGSDNFQAFTPRRVHHGVKPKDLVGIPWRVAFALQADGWWLRSDIIWAKPNPMPESVTDRPTRSHEYVFLLTKSARYFFDAEAVREGAVNGSAGAGSRNYRPFALAGRLPVGQTEQDAESGRNIRTVWTIATQPYPGAHFATFPEALVEPCIKAGSSERGVCPVCGASWVRVMSTHRPQERDDSTRNRDKALARRGMAAVPEKGWESSRETTGWAAACDHDAEPVPAVVLDPFGGSGTTARVANRLSRRAVLIELNPEYIDQAMLRNAQAPLGIVG